MSFGKKMSRSKKVYILHKRMFFYVIEHGEHENNNEAVFLKVLIVKNEKIDFSWQKMCSFCSQMQAFMYNRPWGIGKSHRKHFL